MGIWKKPQNLKQINNFMLHAWLAWLKKKSKWNSDTKENISQQNLSNAEEQGYLI